ncbi:MAG: periplasmic heavy metal sensor [Thermodesulfobacteriota bacterium]|nr:periplasmic heavy metal sensor [Thermodesulfobacteriota bacterium]
MKYKIYILLFFFIFILTTSSFSQPSGTKSNPGMGMKQWRREAKCWGALELSLSLEQRKSLNLIQQTYLQDTQVLRSQLFTKRLEFRELLTDPALKMESIRPKYLEMNEIQSRLEEKAIEYLIRVRSLLTHEQLKFWCPEEEFPFFRRMMRGVGPVGPTAP